MIHALKRLKPTAMWPKTQPLSTNTLQDTLTAVYRAGARRREYPTPGPARKVSPEYIHDIRPWSVSNPL
jgi:hypothetical protein